MITMTASTTTRWCRGSKKKIIHKEILEYINIQQLSCLFRCISSTNLLAMAPIQVTFKRCYFFFFSFKPVLCNFIFVFTFNGIWDIRLSNGRSFDAEIFNILSLHIFKCQDAEKNHTQSNFESSENVCNWTKVINYYLYLILMSFKCCLDRKEN